MDNLNLTTIASLLYGILLLIGGIVGYVKAKSKPSLISGVLSGLLFLLSAFLQWQQVALGLILAQIITILLAIVFIVRLWKTRKFMPAGLMSMISVAMLIILFQTRS